MTRTARGRDRNRAGVPPPRAAEPDADPDDRVDARVHQGWPVERMEHATRAQARMAATSGDATNVPGPKELAEALFRTTHALKYGVKQWCDQSEPLAGATSMPQARLLAELWNAQGLLRMTDVSAALGVTPRNVTTIVDGLEHKGLVRRQHDQHDRRAILLELTEQGRAHIARVQTLHQTIGEQFFAPLDAEERCLLLRLLTKLRAGICPQSDARSDIGG